MIRSFLAGAWSLGTLLALTGTASAAGPAIVVDVASGKVLYANQATAPWYPASITKLMTTYVVMKELQAGRLTLDTPLIVSARAAAAVPSKIGFKPGTEVTVDNALKILMVKSANDVAITIAEGISGSVEDFASRMNSAAAELGMVDSHFVNPNGLPDEANRTSARDMALLGRALLTEFPEYSDLWHIGAIKLGRRVMQNTNGLVGRYPGALGMKTGFICSAGFNVVAAAERGGRKMIAVVLGERNAADRTIRTAELLDHGFGASGWGSQSIYDLPKGEGTPPNKWAEVCGRQRGTPREDDGDEEPVAASLGGNEDSPFAFLNSSGVTGVASVRNPTGKGLAPRAPAIPIVVQAGRMPGSTAIARGPAGTTVAAAPALPNGAQAFAPVSSSAPSLPLGGKPVPLKETAGAPVPLAGSARASAGLGTGAKAAPVASRGAIPRVDTPLAADAADATIKRAPARPIAAKTKAAAEKAVKPATKAAAKPAPKAAAAKAKPKAPAAKAKPAAMAPLKLAPPAGAKTAAASE